jgi:hypothetical protein
MRSKGLVSLIPTILLCLPSLAGAATVLGNTLVQRHMGEWGVFSSLIVASAVFFGGPLVAVAVVISTLLGLSRAVPPKVMYVHYLIVVAAALATVSLTMRFGM